MFVCPAAPLLRNTYVQVTSAVAGMRCPFEKTSWFSSQWLASGMRAKVVQAEYFENAAKVTMFSIGSDRGRAAGCAFTSNTPGLPVGDNLDTEVRCGWKCGFGQWPNGYWAGASPANQR